MFRKVGFLTLVLIDLCRKFCAGLMLTFVFMSGTIEPLG